MHAVNLLPRQIVAPQRRSLQPLALVGAGAVPMIAIVFVVIGYSSAHSTVTAEKAKFAALQAQVAALTRATVPKTTTKSATTEVSAAHSTALISERTARRAELDDVLNKELPWDSMLRNVARVLPDDVWLTALSFTSPVSFGTGTSAAAPTSSPTSAAANNFTISGYGESERSIAVLLVRLRLLPILSNVTLGTTTSTTIGTKQVIQFSVTAAVPPPAGAVPPVTPAPSATTTTTPAG